MNTDSYTTAKAAGMRLDRVQPDAYQLRDGGKVVAVLHRSERGTSAWMNPSYPAGSAKIATDANGWQYVGRAAHLRSMVARVVGAVEATR